VAVAYLKYCSGELSAGLKEITRTSVKITGMLATHPNKVLLEWKAMQNEELHDLCSLPNIIRVMQKKKNKNDGTCDTYGGEQRCMQSFGGEN
jgi:hypothetical protein